MLKITRGLRIFLRNWPLEQEQEEGRRVAKKIIAYASKTLSDSQRRYCTTNKKLLAAVMAVELFKYYLTG